MYLEIVAALDIQLQYFCKIFCYTNWDPRLLYGKHFGNGKGKKQKKEIGL